MTGTMNAWAVLVAALVNVAIGAIWYAPAVFGRKWLALIGKTREELGSPTSPMIIAVLTSLLLSYTMATLMSAAAIDTWMEGMLFSLLLSVGIFGAAMASHLAFEGRPPQLFSINAGYRIVSMMIMGVILASWR